MVQISSMAKLTELQLKALSADDAEKVFREEIGLVGQVRSGTRGITVQFRYDYKFLGKKRSIRIGSWPKTSLSEIRKERDSALMMVRQGIDPSLERKKSKLSAKDAHEQEVVQLNQKSEEDLTLEDLFLEWLEHGVARKDENAELKRSFSKDVLPAIGNIKLSELTDKNITQVLKSVRQRGLNRSVVILNKDISQMLRWGEKRKPWRSLMLEGNPSDLVNLKIIVDKNYVAERDRVLTDAEIKELSERFMQLERDYESVPPGSKYKAIRPLSSKHECALWICLGTLCRIGELLQAKWEHVNLNTRIWHIPAENTKSHAGRNQDHNIYISDFTLEQFKRLKVITGSHEYLFPARNKPGHVCTKSVSKAVGDRQVKFKNRGKGLSKRNHDNTLVLTTGQDREWTPHDLRRTGATVMQKLAIPLDIIDRCQNHVLAGSKVRRHYMHYDYAKETREAWEALGAYLTALNS